MYLDNAATTKMHPEVVEIMKDVSFANYNAKYYEEAINTHLQIDKAISNIANDLQLDEKQIVFTSGATEANNYIIKGLYEKFPEGHFITSVLEHKCVLETFKYLERKGMKVTYLKPNANGEITAKDVENTINKETVLISLMYVNNETGIITDIPTISKIARNKGILLHSDIAQAIGKMEVSFAHLDYASMSGHKIYGPKGIGMAIINLENKPVPLLFGSEQQNENRAGTLPNELIVGLSKAINLVINQLEQNIQKFSNDKISLLNILKDNFGEDLIVNFQNVNTVDNIISIQLKDEINNIFLDDNKGFFKASTGSSCSVNKPSYVLKECGFTDQEIRQTIRLSLSAYDELKF